MFPWDRNDNGKTAIDITIYTLTSEESLDSDALVKALDQGMKKVVEDGSVGNVLISPNGYALIITPTIGTYSMW